ncbi:cytidylate kinase [Chlorobiota bacterium]|nr:cytidylate kinase [Chlorobiota bacterium]
MTSNKHSIIIAIDGPAGSGKSTTARLVAQRLGFIYVDTGAMYRAVTLAWLREEKPEIDIFLNNLPDISLSRDSETQEQKTLLDGVDVSNAIRTSEVTEQVSYISSLKKVREKMVSLQRNIGIDHNVVMDGRDIGTAVFPNADVKIFMIADLKKRASRRLEEIQSKGIHQVPSLDELIQQMKDRDAFDSSREIDPLKMADDALLLDTSNLSIEDQATFIIDKVKSIIV